MIYEGDDIRAYLDERAKKAKAEGVHLDTIQELNDGRQVLARNIPTGMVDKRFSISNEDAQALADKAGIEWFEGFAGRVMRWRASDERVDRHGDIVRQNFDLKDFRENPVLLDCHDWSDIPIGSVINIESETIKANGYSGPATYFTLLFATQEMNPKADFMFRLAQARILRAGSIGFYPLKITVIEDEDERKEMGLGRWGVIYEKSELVEFSLCSVPANAGAVSQSLHRGRKHLHKGDREVFLQFFSEARSMFEDEEDYETAVEAADATFDELFANEELRDVVLESQARIEDLAESFKSLAKTIQSGVEAVKSAVKSIHSDEKDDSDWIDQDYSDPDEEWLDEEESP